MSFLSELKRRNVFRVGAAYAVVAWLLVQIVTVIEEPLSLPPQFDTLTIVALAIGFPIALILAWALELTPAGIRRTDEAIPEDSVALPRGQKLNYLISVGLALVLVMVVIDSYVLRDPPLESAVGSQTTLSAAAEAAAVSGGPGSIEQEKSIAVLPLRIVRIRGLMSAAKPPGQSESPRLPADRARPTGEAGRTSPLSGM